MNIRRLVYSLLAVLILISLAPDAACATAPSGQPPGWSGEMEPMPDVVVTLTSDPATPSAGQPFTLVASIDPKISAQARGVFRLPAGGQAVDGSALEWQGSLVAGQAFTVEARVVLPDLGGEVTFELRLGDYAYYTATLPTGDPRKVMEVPKEPRGKALEGPASEMLEALKIREVQPPSAEHNAPGASLPAVSLTVVRRDASTTNDDHFAVTIYIMANQDAQGVSVTTTPPPFLSLSTGADHWQGDLVNGQVMLLEPEYIRSAPDAGTLVVQLNGAEPYRYPVPAQKTKGMLDDLVGPQAGSENALMAANITYNGRIFYDEDNDPTKRTGALHSTVEVYDSDLGGSTDDFICAAYVAADGWWECTGQADDIDSDIEPYAKLIAFDQLAGVVGRAFLGTYETTSAELNINPNVPATYSFGSWLPHAGFDGAHHIIKYIRYSVDFAETIGHDPIPNLGQDCFLNAYWPNGEDRSYQNDCAIYIAGPGSSDPDEWDESVFLHEHGHYIQGVVADLDPPDVNYCHDPGEDTDCGHQFDSHEDPATAYIEGWADYYQSAVKQHVGIPRPSQYIETTWSVDLETSCHPFTTTWDNAESTIAGILWDINDAAGDDADADGVADQLALGHSEIHDVFSRYNPPDPEHYAPWDIHEFYTGFLSLHGNASQVIKIFFEHGINKDLTAPTGSMALASGATYTTHNPLHLNSSITDVGVGVKELRTRASPTGTWSAWTAYAEDVLVNVPAGDGVKTVYAQYRDYAGNTTGTFTDSVTLDQTRPTGSLVINAGSTYANDLNLTLTISAADTLSGAFQQRFSPNSTTWTAWELLSDTRTYTLTAGEGTRAVYAQYMDRAGNISLTAFDTISIDTTGPTGSIKINGENVYTTTPEVTLTLAAADATSGVMNMRLANGSDAWQPQTPFVNTRSYTLPAGDGVKTVKVQFIDRAGNPSSIHSDTITLDTVDPTCSVLINGGAEWATSAKVQLKPGSADASGVAHMRFTTNTSSWPAWAAYAADPQTITLTATSGTVKIYAQYRDNAKRVSATCSDTIQLDLSKPVSRLTQPSVTRSHDIPISWSATDTGSGVETYDLQMKIDSGEWLDALTGTTTTSLTYTEALPRHTYTWRVRARDAAGNVGAYASGTQFTLYATDFIHLPSVLR